MSRWKKPLWKRQTSWSVKRKTIKRFSQRKTNKDSSDTFTLGVKCQWYPHPQPEPLIHHCFMVFRVLTPTKEPTTALAEDRFCEVRIKVNIHNVSDLWQGSDTGMAHRVGIMCLHPNPVNNPRNIPWHFLCSPQLQRRRESPPYPWLILRHPPWGFNNSPWWRQDGRSLLWKRQTSWSVGRKNN